MDIYDHDPSSFNDGKLLEEFLIVLDKINDAFRLGIERSTKQLLIYTCPLIHSVYMCFYHNMPKSLNLDSIEILSEYKPTDLLFWVNPPVIMALFDKLLADGFYQSRQKFTEKYCVRP